MAGWRFALINEVNAMLDTSRWWVPGWFKNVSKLSQQGVKCVLMIRGVRGSRCRKTCSNTRCSVRNGGRLDKTNKCNAPGAFKVPEKTFTRDQFNRRAGWGGWDLTTSTAINSDYSALVLKQYARYGPVNGWGDRAQPGCAEDGIHSQWHYPKVLVTNNTRCPMHRYTPSQPKTMPNLTICKLDL